MAERVQITTKSHERAVERSDETLKSVGQAAIGNQVIKDIDEILDEIDEVLTETAEEFVNSYVQKGGQ